MTGKRAAERVLDRVEQGPGCWLSALTPSKSYPSIWDRVKHRTVCAHVAVYEHVHGVCILLGHDVHHICEQKRCVNPAHLVLMTKRAHYRLHNIQPQCRRGHEMTSENTRLWGGYRVCATCYELSLARRGLYGREVAA